MLPKLKEEEKVDPRVRRTRQLIQQAFADLMSEKGFEAITVQEIADRATINRVTFYAHFQDKYALLEETIQGMIRERLHRQLPEGSSYSAENLSRLIQTVCEYLDEMWQHCPPPYGQMETLMEKQIKAEVHEIVQDWLAKESPGGTQSGPTLEQAAMVASWAIYGAAVQWLQQERRVPAWEYTQQVLPLILGSLQVAGRGKS
jgi:AcrR family transcriptional regulator